MLQYLLWQYLSFTAISLSLSEAQSRFALILCVLLPLKAVLSPPPLVHRVDMGIIPYNNTLLYCSAMSL